MTNPNPYKLPELPYDFIVLEPLIFGEIMQLHYFKHHNGYVTQLNSALEKFFHAQNAGDISAVASVLQAIKFNGGGHINHSIFWTNLAPAAKGGGEPVKGRLLEALQKEFGSL